MTQSCFGRALSSSFLLNAFDFRSTLSKKSLHHTQSYRSAAVFSNPWLSLCSIVPAAGFDPETRDPEFLWLSRYRCAEPEAQSLKPREWNSDPGTPSGFTPIGGGRYQSRNARRGLENILL